MADMRLSIGAGIGPFRVSQTLARTGGRRRSGKSAAQIQRETAARKAQVEAMVRPDGAPRSWREWLFTPVPVLLKEAQIRRESQR